MFDIGFFELLLISVVGLLVFGPEQFLDAVRTTGLWVRRIRRSFDEVRAEVQREMHNDAVLRELKENADSVKKEFQDATEPLRETVAASRWDNLAEDPSELESNRIAPPASSPSASSSAAEDDSTSPDTKETRTP